MEFLQLPFTTLVYYVVPFLAALMVIVFVHEFGHYYVARLCGVGIQAFSIGFGKEIVGWNDRHGTRWKLCWIPLGGYVKFEGDSNAASLPTSAESPRTATNFHGKPVFQRAAVVAAGPIANFILAALVFTIPPLVTTERVVDPYVSEVVAGSAAEAAGIRAGDKVLELNGEPIGTFADLQRMIFDNNDHPMTLKLDRGGEKITVEATARMELADDNVGGKVRLYRLGLKGSTDPAHVREIAYTVPGAFKKGVEQTWQVVSATLKFIGRMFAGREHIDQLRGPIGLADAAGKIASYGIIPFIAFVALISASIGLVNLFPVPMLDGGHLVYYAIEAIRGKPLGQATQEWGFRIGLSLVMMLMIVATYSDVMRKLGQLTN